MMISLTPMKLFNLAQLALISKLLLNRNVANEVPEKGLEKMAQQKGNVMIFLGKHNIQLSPDSLNQSNLALVIPGDTNGTSRNQSDWHQHQIAPHKALARHSQQNRSSYSTERSPTKLLHGERPHLRKISRSHEPSQQNIFYLPYSTKHNKIQFFDFDRHFIAPSSSNSSNSNDNLSASANEQSTTDNNQIWPSLIRFILKKNPPNQSPEQAEQTKKSKLWVENALSTNWFKHAFQKQLPSEDEAVETISAV